MAIQSRDANESVPGQHIEIPDPVPGGYDHVQSLGHVVDELMRHSRDGESVVAVSELDPKSEDPDPNDPEPITPPPPVPGGDESATRGADPETFETK